MKTLSFFAHGTPKGQPRARACIRGKHASVYDPGTADAWKFSVRSAAKEAWDGVQFEGPLRLKLEFIFPRPKCHFRTGKLADQLKPFAPHHHTAKPDFDNAAKAVCDALTTAGLWSDDAQVSSCTVKKTYGSAMPGCAIEIQTQEETR